MQSFIFFSFLFNIAQLHNILFFAFAIPPLSLSPQATSGFRNKFLIVLV